MNTPKTRKRSRKSRPAQPSLPIAIFLVRSPATQREYHLAIPSADCDYVTNGLLILASTEKEELSIVVATTEEYALGPTQAGGKLCAERINKQEGRSDLRPSIINFDKDDGWAFYDIFSKGAAELIREVTEKEYRAAGGVVRVLRADS